MRYCEGNSLETTMFINIGSFWFWPEEEESWEVGMFLFDSVLWLLPLLGEDEDDDRLLWIWAVGLEEEEVDLEEGDFCFLWMDEEDCEIVWELNGVEEGGEGISPITQAHTLST